MRSSRIEKLLPWVFRRTAGPGTPLRAVLDAMEALHAPAEATLASLDRTFDPRRAPDAFVPFLAGWVDLDWLLAEADPAFSAPEAAFPTGLGRLRELVAAAAFLSQWRGTARGLQAFLETATALGGFRIEEQPPDAEGRPRPFHLRIRCPKEAAPLRSLLSRIVESEKPAYVTYELAFETSADGPPAGAAPAGPAPAGAAPAGAAARRRRP
jgi:phage tail-like protein